MTAKCAAALEETGFPRQTAGAIVEGTVRDSLGAPVARADLLLEEKSDARVVTTKTRADGTYVLKTDHAGTYTVRAKKAGFVDTVADAIVLSPGDKRHIDVVLSERASPKFKSSAAEPAAKGSSDGMEFKDEPNFTVAGVTDWSNLGLHGSAATSRTSESLAKETRALRSSEPDEVSSPGVSMEYEAAIASRDKGDFAGARQQVRKALAVADNAEGHRLLGELDEESGDPLDAVHEYERAARMEPSERNYFEWGAELLLHKASEPAAEVFARGHNAHPVSARILMGLGAALYASGSAEEAARRLCEAADLQPADSTSYLFLGKIEKSTPGPLPCTEQKLARFAQRQPENALANYYYAISLWKRRKGGENPPGLKEVEALLEKAVAIDPKCDEAYLQLGVLRATRGEVEPAIREFKKAIEANPNLGEAHRQLGLAYQRTGEKAKASQEFAAYEQLEKAETVETEREQKELRQFLIILNKKPAMNRPK